MKINLSAILIVFIGGSSPARSEETPTPQPATARILGNIPDGTPPPPEPAKTRFIVPTKDILESKTHEQGGRTITLQQIAPIPLPPPPAKGPPVDIADPDIQQRIAEARENAPAVDFLFISASVFHAQDSPPRTLATLWGQGHGEPITFWSTADFALLSGFASFVGSDGIKRSLMMAWSPHEIESISDLAGNAATKNGLPHMPDLPAGKATFVITSGNPAAATLASIQSLHDLYNNEHDRLLTAYQGRERARLQQEAELKANPPQPMDITLNYWNIGAAAPTEGGSK